MSTNSEDHLRRLILVRTVCLCLIRHEYINYLTIKLTDTKPQANVCTGPGSLRFMIVCCLCHSFLHRITTLVTLFALLDEEEIVSRILQPTYEYAAL